MNRYHHRISAILYGAALAAVLSWGVLPRPTSADETKSLQVRLKESKLRSQPKFWAASVADLKYGDTLTLLGSEASWFKVKSRSGATGFVHPSVVTDKKVTLSGGGSVERKADTSDVVLAGKGFSKEVEAEYAHSNPDMNFKAVNHMEGIRVGSQELLGFLREGKLGNGRL